MKVTIKGEPEIGLNAFDIAEGVFFRDREGDLYLRVEGGALNLSTNELAVYSNLEIKAPPGFKFFEECVTVQAEIDVSVTLT